jgi:formylglycine-generating enzyme
MRSCVLPTARFPPGHARLVRCAGMRRVASGILVAFGLAAATAWAGCGGEAFTTAQSIDSDGATESSTPSGGDASTGPSTGVDARPEGELDTGSSPAEAGTSAPPDGTAPLSACPAGRGPKMVVVDAFCIDGTEATTGQYNDFLLAGPSLSAQPPECSWNVSYLPGNGWSFVPAQATLPIANVSWCDAYAFCKWAGKRLCGKIGGGPADFSQFGSTDNEHYMACSNASTRIYPYGNMFDATACNGVDMNMGHVVPVGSLSGCQGGVPGLFDMSGNVEEWQDSCDGNTGANDSCRDGAGAFDYGDPPDGTRCDFADQDMRSGQFPDVGIRCCASLP